MSIYIGDKLVANALDHKTKMDKANPEGTGSFSMNRKADTLIGNKSVAIGGNNEASSTYSVAIGYDNVSKAGASIALGAANTASGNRAVALGVGNTASGFGSFAEGVGNVASGNCTHAEGYHTIATGTGQHVSGKYNTEDTSNTYACIVGGGNADNNRTNIYTLDWDGNGIYEGYVFAYGPIAEQQSSLINDLDLYTMLNRDNTIDQPNTSYSTYMVRGEALYPKDSTNVPTVNGTIAWYYS